MSKLKLMTIVGTRPEIIRLAAGNKKCMYILNRFLFIPDKIMIIV